MRLLSTTALAFAALATSPADAACVASSAGVTCTGTDIDGYRSANGTAVAVTVGAGARVTNDGAPGNASPDALRLRGGGTVTIAEGGAVDTTGPDGDDAIQTEGSTSIDNAGAIRGFDEGVNAEGTLTILNRATGVIEANDDAIKGERIEIVNFGRIENVGTDLSDPQDAIDLDYGSVRNEAGGVIRSTLDAAIDFDETDDVTVSQIVNFGRIEGTIGVLTDPANVQGQIVSNFGTLIGTSGVAVDLGGGDDTYVEGGFTSGDVKLGDGDDTFVLDGARFGDLSGNLIDGGEGADTMSLLAFRLTDVVRLQSLPDDVYRIDLGRDATATSLRFAGFQTFLLSDPDDGTSAYGIADLAGIAPVPVPAAAWMLLAGLGALMGIRRRD